MRFKTICPKCNAPPAERCKNNKQKKRKAHTARIRKEKLGN